MTKSCSLDLRRRVARFVAAGRSCHEAARHFDVSVAFVVRLMAAYRAPGSLVPKPEGGWRYSKLDPHRDFLVGRVAEARFIYSDAKARKARSRHRWDFLRSRQGLSPLATGILLAKERAGR